ncbi:MAG: DMT family transporter [Maritimibacter harenae]|jgi:drug/metabolite transporter (DMT)-like permease|uniref:EamA family transporter n=1 Tax=Maritimibacter harenae TaxID=2606218 RepID=A0A845M4R8_9RHOB|nr:DMT family transporter [Maritimibacter harenae]MZR15340.1 EamA family transporter [Maritimibacter harenae]
MPFLGPLYALAGFALFATHDAIIKYLGGTYSPFQIIFFATLFSFPLVSFMLMRDATQGNLRPVHPWWTTLRTICAVIAQFSAFYAFSVLPLAQTYVLLFATPLLITLIAIPILGEKVGIHRLGAVVVGLVGVLVVLQPRSGAEFSIGHLAGISSAVFNSLASVIVRKIGRDERPVVLMLYPMAANFIVMGALLALVYVPMPVTHLGGLAVISALGFTAGLFMIAGYKNGDAAIVAPMQYSQIIWASLFGYIFFAESVDRPTLIGAGIIILSGLYIVFRETRRGPDSQTPVLRTRSRGATAASFRISLFLRRAKARG